MQYRWILLALILPFVYSGQAQVVGSWSRYLRYTDQNDLNKHNDFFVILNDPKGHDSWLPPKRPENEIILGFDVYVSGGIFHRTSVLYFTCRKWQPYLFAREYKLPDNGNLLTANHETWKSISKDLVKNIEPPKVRESGGNTQGACKYVPGEVQFKWDTKQNGKLVYYLMTEDYLKDPKNCPQRREKNNRRTTTVEIGERIQYFEDFFNGYTEPQIKEIQDSLFEMVDEKCNPRA